MDREWTDKRMDDLADQVGRFEANVDRRFDKVDERFDKVDERFDKIDAGMKATNRTIWAGIIVVGISKFLFG